MTITITSPAAAGTKSFMNSVKRILIFALCFQFFTAAAAAQEKFDIVTFQVPKGWQKEVQESAVQIGTENAQTGGMCLITVFKSIPGAADPKANFNAAWETIVKELVKPTGKPQMQPAGSENGWSIESGLSPYEQDGKQGVVLLVTATGGGKMLNVVILTNSDEFEKDFTAFLDSIVLPKVAASNPPPPPAQTPAQTNTVSQSAKRSSFKYNTTNFDDGWAAIEQEDWVRVTKGNVTVLLHYPKEGTIFPADPEPLTNAAWNILVAPRYSRLRNYKTVSPSLDFERPYLAFGYLTDNQTNKEVFVVLFRKGTGWFEVIAPDKNAFVQQYKFDPEQVRWDTDTAVFNELKKMPGYNRFAVTASDFGGTWTSNFSAVQQMYFANTGNYAGINMNQSSEEFVFNGGNYSWKLLAVRGMVGSQTVSQAKSSGTLSVLNEWQIRLSNIEGKPKTYHAFFSCIKGARLLHLMDANSPGSGIYTVFGKVQ